MRQLYVASDLHGNNNLLGIIDGEGRRIFKKKLPNDPLVERFRINISINRVHMANSNLIHFVFPFEDNWHLVDLVNVLEDPFFELRF